MHIKHICTFFSATIDGRDLVFGHKLHTTVTEKNATKNILDGRTEVKQYTLLPLRGAGV
jgi:hypothetical protein